MSDIEIPLEGGNVNAEVVRIGDTVRRAMSPSGPTVHKLLMHLEAKGFHASPRFLGVDDKGREILSFIEGDTDFPADIWTEDTALIATAKMQQRFHQATEDFVTDNAIWAKEYRDPAQFEVICHNDFAPYNFIYANGLPKAVIDFDLVGPGPRLRDVAYTAYWMVPLSFNADDMAPFAIADVKAGSRRLKLFCDTYGIPANTTLLDMVQEVLLHMSDEQAMIDVVGADVAAKLKADGHLDHWQREAEAFAQNRASLPQA